MDKKNIPIRERIRWVDMYYISNTKSVTFLARPVSRYMAFVNLDIIIYLFIYLFMIYPTLLYSTYYIQVYKKILTPKLHAYDDILFMYACVHIG